MMVIKHHNCTGIVKEISAAPAKFSAAGLPEHPESPRLTSFGPLPYDIRQISYLSGLHVNCENNMSLDIWHIVDSEGFVIEPQNRHMMIDRANEINMQENIDLMI